MLRCWNAPGLEVTHAVLFDRPTPLEGENGLRNWVEMFARDLTGRVSPGDRESFLRHAEDAARPTLHRDGTWWADYRRLRHRGVPGGRARGMTKSRLRRFS